MYKKITHSIIEEHYDHPDVLTAIPSNKPDIKPTIADTTLSNILRRRCRDAMVHYVSRMRDTVLAISNGTADRALAVQLASTEITKLAEIFNRYYPINQVDTLSRELGIMTSTAIEMAAAEKDGTDSTIYTVQNTNSIEALAVLMSSLMDSMWFKDELVTLFTEVVDNWVGQVRARKISDWPTDFRLAVKNESWLVAGTPITLGFAEVFANSIVSSFPEQF